MADNKILDQRSLSLNAKGSTQINSDGQSVIYIMSRDQRVEYNPALLKAQELALDLKLPLLVVFQLYPQLGHRLKQHYDFMLGGLKELHQQLADKNIDFLVLTQDLEANSAIINNQLKPAVVVADFSPLKRASQVRSYLVDNLNCKVLMVDAHNVVPVWIASKKQEYNAYFFRRKITPLLADYLIKPAQIQNQPDFTVQKIKKTAANYAPNWKRIQQAVLAQPKPQYSFAFKSGYQAAQDTLQDFLENKLIKYDQQRNDPNAEVLSNLSPYLHFGQISSLEIALAVKDYVQQKQNTLSDKDYQQLSNSQDNFLEELIVRKELADNYCYYNSNYLSVTGLADWAQTTLAEHELDQREHLYSLTELDQAQTHDNAWNAAQTQMKHSGKMHGYMRMYWAKKILEWTPDAQTAIDYAVKLNDTYNLDGHDPNGYVGILWSIGGLHDRPWPERKIFGKVRYMSYDGLKRKFDLEKYINKYINS